MTEPCTGRFLGDSLHDKTNLAVLGIGSLFNGWFVSENLKVECYSGKEGENGRKSPQKCSSFYQQTLGRRSERHLNSNSTTFSR